MNAAALQGMLEGLRFLHMVVKRIHRDIEDKHVGRSKSGRLCMFDLDTSMALEGPSSCTAVGYAGEINTNPNMF